MIQSIYIKNFKAWKNANFSLNGGGVIFVGEHGSGKSSILQALDCFFNQERIDDESIIDHSQDVEIGIRINRTFLKKRFIGKAHRAVIDNPEADWSQIDGLYYLYVLGTEKSPLTLVKELARSRVEQMIDPRFRAQFEALANQAIDSVLNEMNDALALNGSKPGEITAKSKLNPSRAVNYDLSFDETFVNEVTEHGPSVIDDLISSSLTAGNYKNVIFGIDGIEDSFKAADFPYFIERLSDTFGQLLLTTHSQKILQSGHNLQTIPVGDNPQMYVAELLSGLRTNQRAFLLVEGKFDLPWYRKALELLGATDLYTVLPGGGSNVELLRKELIHLGLHCVLIFDGDMKSKENRNARKYALSRDCVELYTPDSLLKTLFNCIPPKHHKKAFFTTIRKTGTHLSDDGIKDMIAERIADSLDENSEFIKELGEIIAFDQAQNFE